MTKEEMKNKISMALKDPILQQGFECICKENAELEELLDKQIEATYKLFEENKELKEKYLRATDEGTSWAHLKSLEQEKAKLKENIEIQASLIRASFRQHEKDTQQLTYAKTIIQDLLDNTDEYARQRAEDFLKECE